MARELRERASDMLATGYDAATVARATGLDVETVEYMQERQWLAWAAQYGYDN